MGQEGIIGPRPETTDWVHNLMAVVSHQKCALHCFLGGCTAQFPEWTVLLNHECKIRILDKMSRQGPPATHCFQHTVQEILLCTFTIWTVSIV